jgi:hypothetical protein
MLVAAMFAAPAGAEVKSATAFGFEVETRVVVSTGPAEAYAALTRPASWWNGAHSYSDDAANLTLDARAGGCFCEALPGGGGVEHMRVVYAEPGATLRLQGGLGPLQAEGAAGALTWALKKVDGGTQITQTYVVGGYMRMGAEKLAPLVDKVLVEQLARLQAKLGPRR